MTETLRRGYPGMKVRESQYLHSAVSRCEPTSFSW